MAYTDDWENLMNGVFGPGGKLRFDTQKTPPEKSGLPDMNAPAGAAESWTKC